MNTANHISKMTVKDIPFYKPNVLAHLSKEIEGVLENPQMNKADELEREFCRYTKSHFAIATNSASSALHLCFYGMQLKRGDKIICSVNCHPMIPEMIRQFDAEPIFIDINSFSLLDLVVTERYITKHSSKKLKGIIISYIAGQTYDVYPFYEFARGYNLKIIEDLSYALGAEFNGVKLGCSNAERVLLETQSGNVKLSAKKKKMQAETQSCEIATNHYTPFASIFGVFIDSSNSLAQCGMITTNDEEFANSLKLMRYHAIVEKKSPGYLYDVVDIGNKFNVPNLDACCALEELRVCDENIAIRRSIAHTYLKELADIPHIELPPIIDLNNHIFTLFMINIDKNRDHFAGELQRYGIQTQLHFIPIYLLSYYKNKYGFKISDFPNALKHYQKTLSIPIYGSLKAEEVYYICENIIKVACNRV